MLYKDSWKTVYTVHMERTLQPTFCGSLCVLVMYFILQYAADFEIAHIVTYTFHYHYSCPSGFLTFILGILKPMNCLEQWHLSSLRGQSAYTADVC